MDGDVSEKEHDEVKGEVEFLRGKLVELNDIVVAMEELPVDNSAHEYRFKLKKILEDVV